MSKKRILGETGLPQRDPNGRTAEALLAQFSKNRLAGY